MPDDELRVRPEFEYPPPRIDDDEGDGEPYRVHSEIVKTPKIESPPIVLSASAKSWETLWPLTTRLKILYAILTLNVGLLPVGWLLTGNVPATFSALIVNSLLQAFLLGTFDRIDLIRSDKGKVSLTRTWRIAFYSLQPARIRWSEF